MTAAQELMDRLADLDIKLEIEGDNLRLNAPKGVLSAALKQELVALKPELLALLNSSSHSIKPMLAGLDIPLTSGQQRLWELNKLQQDNGIYNVPMVYRLQGALDVKSLELSLNKIHKRHEILRTRFCEVDGTPLQQVVYTAPLVLEITDYTTLPDTEQSAMVEKAFDTAIQQPFNLNTPPLWRCVLQRLKDDEHILIFIMHHMVFDRFSKTVFLRELETLYAKGNVPDLAIQYSDFAYWQQSKKQRKVEDKQMAYWQEQLSGTVAELLLPTDHPRAAVTSVEGRSLTFSLPAAISKDLKLFSRTARVSLYMTLLAALHALLYRYTGQTDQVICSPYACRNQTDIEALIGYFNNIVPIRTKLTGSMTFQDLLDRVRQVTIDASKHQDVAFQRIAKLPNLANIPLTRCMFNFRSDESSALNLTNLTATPVDNRRHQADFDLALYMGIENDRLTGVLDYNANIFEENTITFMLEHFQALLQQVVADPNLLLNALPQLRSSFSSIENILIKHRKVDDAVVVVRSDIGRAGNLAAYLVLNEFDIPTWEELRSVIDQQLPAYQDYISFIPVDEIPILADGSVDLALLPAPARCRTVLGNEYVAPRTSLEKELVNIWRRVLWCEEEIGIYDNFFDLGGHSLLSVELILETEKHLKRPVPEAALTQLTNIADFVGFLNQPAEVITAMSHSGLDIDIYHSLQTYTASWIGKRISPDSLVVGLNTDGIQQPVFWCIQRYLNMAQLAKHLGPERPFYGMRSGHNVMDSTLENIRPLAHYYVDEILKIQSSGPYIVGGICQAVRIAFHMALRLMDLGHEVNLLGLQERFIPQDYSGRIAFFFGDDSDRNPYFHYAQPELGWRKYYTGHIETHFMSGKHGQYFQEANIHSLAGKMQTAFEHANTTVTPQTENEVMLQRLNSTAYQAQLTLARPVGRVRNATTQLIISVKNTSPNIWLASERSGVFLGARWRDPDKSDMQAYCHYQYANIMRTPLLSDLKPGNMIELKLTVIIPEDSKLNVLEVDMVDEGITWFSDAGSELLQIKIHRDE